MTWKASTSLRPPKSFTRWPSHSDGPPAAPAEGAAASRSTPSPSPAAQIAWTVAPSRSTVVDRGGPTGGAIAGGVIPGGVIAGGVVAAGACGGGDRGGLVTGAGTGASLEGGRSVVTSPAVMLGGGCSRGNVSKEVQPRSVTTRAPARARAPQVRASMEAEGEHVGGPGQGASGAFGAACPPIAGRSVAALQTHPERAGSGATARD